MIDLLGGLFLKLFPLFWLYFLWGFIYYRLKANKLRNQIRSGNATAETLPSLNATNKSYDRILVMFVLHLFATIILFKLLGNGGRIT